MAITPTKVYINNKLVGDHPRLGEDPFLIYRRTLFGRVMQIPRLILKMWKLNQGASLKHKIFFCWISVKCLIK